MLKPGNIDPNILANETTQVRVNILQVQTIVKKRNWAVILGFWRGVSNKIRECLWSRNHKQLYTQVFKHKRLTLWSYTTYLKTKRVILDKL